MKPRLALAAIALTTVTGTAVVAAAPAANADTPLVSVPDVTCTGTSTISYSSPLMAQAQQVNASVVGTLSTCVSLGQGPTSGSYSQNFSANLSCTAVLSDRPDQTRTITWSDNSTSDVTITSLTTRIGGLDVVTLTGSVSSTSEKFANDTFSEVTAYPALPTCPVSALSGFTVLTLAPPSVVGGAPSSVLGGLPPVLGLLSPVLGVLSPVLGGVSSLLGGL